MTTQAPLRVRLGVDVGALVSALFGFSALTIPFVTRASLSAVLNGIIAGGIVFAAVAASRAARAGGRVQDAIRPAVLIFAVGAWVSAFALVTAARVPYTPTMVALGAGLAFVGAYHAWACAQARHYVTRRMFV